MATTGARISLTAHLRSGERRGLAERFTGVRAGSLARAAA